MHRVLTLTSIMALACACMQAMSDTSVQRGPPVIDTHVHLTNLSLFNYTWLPQFQRQLGYTWTLQNYSDATRPTALEARYVVFIEAHVEPGSEVAEAKYIQTVAEQQRRAAGPNDPLIGAIVASAPIDQGADAVRRTVAEMTSDVPLLRGIRKPVPFNASNACSFTKGAFSEGVGALAALNLSFELLMEDNYQGLPCAHQLIAAHPNVTFVLEHIGSPNMSAPNAFTPWAQAIDRLAQYPNVNVKISGVPREALRNSNYDDWDESEVRPWIQHVLSSFGSHRCIFGGNWFFTNLSTTYRRWVAVVADLVASLPTDEQSMVLFENARRIYRIQTDSL